MKGTVNPNGTFGIGRAARLIRIAVTTHITVTAGEGEQAYRMNANQPPR